MVVGLRLQRLLKKRKEAIDHLKLHLKQDTNFHYHVDESPEPEESPPLSSTESSDSLNTYQDRDAADTQSTFVPYVMSHDHGESDHDAKWVAKGITYLGRKIHKKGSKSQNDDSGIFDAIWLNGDHDGFPLSSFIDYWNLRLESAGFPTCPRHARCPHSPDGEFAPIAQCHLTYGIVEAVTGIKIPEKFLLRCTSSGKIVMSFDGITHILHYLVHYVDEASSKTLERWCRRAHAELTRAWDWFEHELECHEPDISGPNIHPDDVAKILCMIAAILEALSDFVRHCVSRHPRPLRHGLSFTQIHTGKFGDIYREKLLQDGWCPFAIEMLSCAGIIPLAYAYRCGPSSRGDILYENDNHKRCTPTECMRNAIDIATYSNRHVTGTCRCEYLAPPKNTVEQMILNGDIPVIRVQSTSTDQSPHSLQPGADLQYDQNGEANNNIEDVMPTVSCRKSSSTPYVAISHVWADGLGSTTEKGLPLCLMKQLGMMAGRLVTGGAFWIDSLCVPRDKRTRALAIGKMAQIYREAEVVLVIDSGIQRCSLKTPYTEIKLRIATSGWMQRVWTLQEACLARKLVFKLSDGYMDMKDVPGHTNQSADARLSKILNTILAPAHKSASETCHCSINDISHRLAWRNIGRAHDETLAIAALLYVDAKELVMLPPESRMAKLLLSVRSMHSSVVFKKGPKIKVPGFRWASRSLIGHDSHFTMACDAICTDQGLETSYPCICFEKTTFRRDEVWFLRLGKRPVTGGCFIIMPTQDDGGSDEYTCDGIIVPEVPDSGDTVGGAVLLCDRDTTRSQAEDARLAAIWTKRLYVRAAGYETPKLHPNLRVIKVRSLGKQDLLLT